MASVAKKAKLDQTAPKPCPYGASCYRKNPAHFVEFSHPQDRGDSSSSSTTKDNRKLTASLSVDTSSLPPCKYGAKCYRKNLLHFAEYSHPSVVADDGDEDSGDTDVQDSDDDEDKKKDTSKGTDNSLEPGMLLTKSFTKMTEQERRELIRAAFEAKKKLEEELEATKKQVEEKDRELNRLQEELSKGMLMVDGEKEALEKKETAYFTLLPERHYKEGSADQIHFRLAESQFYRLLSGEDDQKYRVSKVQYVVNPTLVKKFKAARENVKKTRGEDMSYPVLGFHGTDENNITPICETGFRMPGQSGFKEKTDAGWYGAGIYFSEYPSYSMDYIDGATRLLLCQVLPGKVYNCTEIKEGSKLQKGYDSHMSPDKKELVIFSSDCILPSYIVHYASPTSDFIYKKAAAGMKRVRKVGAPAPHTGTLDTKLKNAKKKALSTIFKGKSILVQLEKHKKKNAQLQDLVVKHKGQKGDDTKYDILVIGEEDEYENQTIVEKALEDDKPVVTEHFILESILHNKFLDPDHYLHPLYDE
ncbi:uncharacterized protein LOC143293605 [Babylonia areolata]|uniref:uncharacterized protein LOC143293605 n=1 Tax=Babylonia areolata TaxID=304850 RepID=UPI003FD6A352